MSLNREKSSWKHRFRITIYNDQTFEEIWQTRLTKLGTFTLIGAVIISLIALTTILIAFTNLREFIPGYPDGNMRRNIIMTAYRLDSLENELHLRDQYFNNINAIISGKEPVDFQSLQDTSKSYENITFNKSAEDSLLRIQIEQEEQYNLSTSEYEENNKGSKIINQHFFTPLKGVVTSKFNPVDNHFGTDIVAESNTIVSAVLDGTVIMAGWTLETGYVIGIQHGNNIISVYKHNAELLKDIGTVVKAGETISIIGNSGELYTSGTHLHFELWHNGTPIDPEQYIIF
jgi:murein DD-endopeptidase MepM/ murein hydrolase activator NlpD